MLSQPQNKMQQQAGAAKTCPVCRGTKVVQGRDNSTLTCHACRGTGMQQGSYQTK